VFFATDCDCAEQLRLAFKMMAEQGAGIVIHLAQEGRGQGMETKIRACQLMACEGLDTVEAYARLGLQQDVREYGIVASILRALKVTSVSLLTNNPKKAEGVSTAGVCVNRVVPILAAALPERVQDLKVKRDKLGHLLPQRM
jgi:GTP cyclohydrolase II